MFLGRALLERTTFTYVDGQLVESTTVRESPWTDEDRDWELAYLAERDERCGNCGQPLALCMDPETRQTWTVDKSTCQACLVLEAVQAGDASAKTKSHGRKYSVRQT